MIARVLLMFLTLTWVALAAEPASRNPIPDPQLLLESDSYSIAVISLQGDRVPIQTLLTAALNSIATGEAKLPASMADAADYLARNNRADLLIAGLPYQAVRIDKMLPTNQTSPCYASTLSGWRGLQVQIYNGLAAGADGKPFPSVVYRRTELVSRDHADDPTWAGTLCKVNGTLLFSPTPDHAKKIVDRLMPKDPARPASPEPGALLAAYQALPKTSDAFGVLLNQKQAFSALLKSINNEHIQKIRDKVGNDRLEQAAANTQRVVWQVNIVTDDRAEFQAVLTVGPANVAQVASVFEDGKAALDTTKVADVTVTPGTDNVTVKLAVIGLKKLVLDSLAKGTIM
ncbi:MAG: hypothetical protein AB1758_29650 [Candidatus Eremiobacterota bacterium]